MRSLFFRIFLSFWIAMALILAGAIGLTESVAWHRFIRLNGIDAAGLVGRAGEVLQNQGLDGLKGWLADIVRTHPDLDITIVDDKGADILGRPLSARTRDWLKQGFRAAGDPSGRSYNWTYGYDWTSGGLAPPGLSLNRSHLLANPRLHGPDGSVYTILMAWLGASPWDSLLSYGTTLPLLLIALIVSAVICWWIAHTISRPVDRLRLSARTLALGRLDALIEEEFCARQDELGTLARDFNQMAGRMRTQIAAKETLIRDISHELRSPLTRLRVALELARRKEGDPSIQFERIERDLERLDSMIEEMLTLARLSEGGPGLAHEQVDLAVLLADLAEDARLEAALKGLSIESRIASPLVTRGDGELLFRAVDNIVRNAIRFSPKDGIIRIEGRQAANGVTILVRDHGPGVPESDLPHIFEAFYRVAEARDRDSGGSGLGLAIAARIMALHGGGISARNAPGGGLMVELRLPNPGPAD